jgi:hypothetical protein
MHASLAAAAAAAVVAAAAVAAAVVAAAAAQSHVWKRFLFRVAFLIVPTLQDAAFLHMVRLTAQTKIHHITAAAESQQPTALESQVALRGGVDQGG